MSNDSFIREVNEEIRQDRARLLWDRYGIAAIGVAVAVVVATGAFVGWTYWTESKANASGDAFTAALALANDGKSDEALAALKSLQGGGYGAYPLLARMRTATVLAEKGDFKGAVAEFDAVDADGSIPQALRDMARLRAGYILVDNGAYADVYAHVQVLADDSNALRHAAREALGLSAWKEGKTADALKAFDQISADESAPRNARDRAAMLVGLIRGSSPTS